MNTVELYLKTIFCCMACDGEIAEQEIEIVKKICSNEQFFKDIDVENKLNKWINEINNKGVSFLKGYLNELSSNNMNKEEELQIVDFAIKTIEADEKVEYSEIKLFKKIRALLSVSDEEILELHPDKEEFLLPDIGKIDDLILENILYSEISFSQ